MKIRQLDGYQTCAYSLKRKKASWKVTGGCENRARLFTGLYYALPSDTVCMTCPFYVRDERISDREK